MAIEHRAELQKIIMDLEDHVQALRSFGLTVVRPRQMREVDLKPLNETHATTGTALSYGSGRQKPAHEITQSAIAPLQGSLFGSPAPEKSSITVPISRPRWAPNRLSTEQAEQQLKELRQTIGDCTRCKLAAGRNTIVFGEGDPIARLMFVGEGPGQEEDRTGRPFVGRAGKLLDRIVEAMGLQRRQVYIGNVVKCRPPSNRTPEDDEMRTCGQFLAKQVEIIRPRHIVCLGATAAAYLLNTKAAMNKIRGRFFDDSSGARILPTFHPAYLLRNPAAKKSVWEDMQKVMAEMQEPLEG